MKLKLEQCVECGEYQKTDLEYFAIEIDLDPVQYEFVKTAFLAYQHLQTFLRTQIDKQYPFDQRVPLIVQSRA